MVVRIFLGHLPTRATERDIENFCRGFGHIREIILKTGFGFVDFEDGRDAEDAIRSLNGRDLMGCRVAVEECKPRRQDDRDSHRSSRSRDYKEYDRFERRDSGDRFKTRPTPKWLNKYGAPEQTRYKLVVENLSTRVSWQDLKDLMRSCGEVTYADAHRQERNVGIVCFTNHSALLMAMDKFQGKEINGRRIRLVDNTKSVSRSASPSVRRSPSRSRSPQYRSSRSPRKHDS